MRKIGILLTIGVAVLVMTVLVSTVMAAGITIDPANPIKSSDGIFKASAKEETQKVYALLVMTETCYSQLTGQVNIGWTGENGGVSGNKDVATWYGPISGSIKIPESSVIASYSIKNGDGYTASSCRDHLGVSEDLYYAWVQTTMIIGTDEVTITIKVPANNVNMLVYLAGQTDNARNDFELDANIPPTPAGLFVVPESALGTLAVLGAAFAALAIVKIKKRP